MHIIGIAYLFLFVVKAYGKKSVPPISDWRFRLKPLVRWETCSEQIAGRESAYGDLYPFVTALWVTYRAHLATR